MKVHVVAIPYPGAYIDKVDRTAWQSVYTRTGSGGATHWPLMHIHNCPSPSGVIACEANLVSNEYGLFHLRNGALPIISLGLQRRHTYDSIVSMVCSNRRGSRSVEHALMLLIETKAAILAGG